jgi:bifunctional polynucleotide phosphatase/kinase
MWKLLENEIDGNKVKLDPKSFIYVGDAAGREKNNNGKKDHSDSDHKFGINVGGTFQTPEEFFLGQTSNFPKKFKFNPHDYKSAKLEEKEFNINEKQQEMIIYVGSPGSGKSSFYEAYFSKHGYVHVNNDTLKTAVKCLKVSEEALSSGKSVVVDNTNPTKSVRSLYISLAEKYKIPVRCFFFKYPKELVFHLNNLRDINLGRKHHTKSVPDVVIHTWFKNMEEPSLSEGFKEIKVIPFVPGPFQSTLDEEIFFLHSSN